MIPTTFIVGEGVGEEQGRPMTFFGNLMRIVAAPGQRGKSAGRTGPKHCPDNSKSLSRLNWRSRFRRDAGTDITRRSDALAKGSRGRERKVLIILVILKVCCSVQTPAATVTSSSPCQTPSSSFSYSSSICKSSSSNPCPNQLMLKLQL